MKDPYEVLGVSRNASDSEIKTAYRELVKKYHPDNYANNPLADLASEKMKEINEAYDAVTKARSGQSSGSYQSGGYQSYNNYQSGGAASAKDFVEAVFGVKVDKYMKFNSAAFKKACDILGCVKYPVNADIAGFKNDGTEQDLNSDQIEQFITYELFSGGEAERTVIASDVLRAMINQQKGKNIADNLDISFEAIINMVETDVNAVDYKNRKGAIKYMLENGNTIAGSIALDGKTAGDDFIPSASSIEKIKEQYFTDAE